MEAQIFFTQNAQFTVLKNQKTAGFAAIEERACL